MHKFEKNQMILIETHKIISERNGFDIDSMEFQKSLVIYFKLGDISELYEIDFTSEEIIEILKKHHFSPNQSVILGEIDISEDFLPEGIEQSLVEVEIKKNGDIWQVHQNDADPFPSNPHAHNYEKGLKLDLSNGDLYHGSKLVSKINKKHFMDIRNMLEIKKITLPTLSIS